MKRTITLLFTMVLLISLFATQLQAAPNKGFTLDGRASTIREIEEVLKQDLFDEQNNYKVQFYDEAVGLWKKNLLKGSKGHFNLDQALTRAEGAILIVRILGKEEEALSQKLECKFKDVPAWARDYVAYALAHGITKGYSETSFAPNETLSANQFITMVLRAVGYDDSKGHFKWDKAAEKAYELWLISGGERTRYMKTNVFFRDDVAHIVNEALNIVVEDGKNLRERHPDVNTGEAPRATEGDMKQSN